MRTNFGAFDQDTISTVIAVLEAAKFEEFLASTIGGDRDKEYRVRSIKYTARFLAWSYFRAHSSHVTADGTLPWLRQLIQVDYTALDYYSQHLEKEALLKPGTVKNHLHEILNCAQWYTLYAGDSRLPIGSLAGMQHVCKSVCNTFPVWKFASDPQFQEWHCIACSSGFHIPNFGDLVNIFVMLGL